MPKRIIKYLKRFESLFIKKKKKKKNNSAFNKLGYTIVCFKI